MNRTLKVTGFSLKPRIRLQLEELFSRVSQVDKVFLSPDRNAAFVRLAWKSSVSFVMELRWEINNEQLNVRPAVNPTSNQNLRQPPLSDSSCISSLTDGWEKQKHYGTKCVQTYQEYCAGESQFWKDVPHQNFGQVPAGKLKRKKKQLNRNIMWSSVSVPSSEMKRGCQPKKKKKKPKSFLFPAKSFEFGVTCGKYQISAQTPFPETVPRLQSLSSKQEEPDMQQYRAEDDLQLTDPTSYSFQEGPQDVKVFIKADKTYSLTLQRPTTPTEVCKAARHPKWCSVLPPESLEQNCDGQHEQHIQNQHSFKTQQADKELSQHQQQDHQQKTQFIPSTSHKSLQLQSPYVIEVFVKGHQTSVLSLPLPTTASEVLLKVAMLLQVPPELLHITVQGHGLSNETASKLQPGSTLHCIVKGKGGMERSQSQTQETGPAIAKRKAEGLNKLGNEAYKAAKYEDAVLYYTQSLSAYPATVTFNNRAQAYLHLCNWDAAESDCNSVLELEPQNIKALVRRGKALKEKKNYQCACQDLSKVMALCPGNTEALALILQIKKEELELTKHANREPKSPADQVCQEKGLFEGAAAPEESPIKKRKKKKKKKRAKTASTETSTSISVNDPLVADDAGNDGGQNLAPQVEEDIVTSKTAGDQPSRAARNKSADFEPAGTTGCQAILQTSDIEEVKAWLQCVCHLTEEDIQGFKGFDGHILFEYTDNDLQKLMRHTKISLGTARKIFYLRDNPQLGSSITKWSVSDVFNFAEKVAGNKEDVQCFHDHQIDGPAFLSYDRDEELERDLKLDGRLAFQIIAKRKILIESEKESGGNEAKEAQTEIVSETCEEDAPGETFHVENKTDAQTSVNVHDSPDNGTDSGGNVNDMNAGKAGCFPIAKTPMKDFSCEFSRFLRDELCLQLPAAERDMYADSKLHVIYHKRKEMNELEEQFLFLVLCKPSLFQGRDAKPVYSKLWKIIVDHVPSQFWGFLSQHSRFTRSEKGVLFENRPIEFDMKPQAKVSPLPEYEKVVRKVGKCANKVLIVDRQLLDKCNCYSLEVRLEKEPHSFQICFDRENEYFFFDSEDFDSGIIKEKISKWEVGNSDPLVHEHPRFAVEELGDSMVRGETTKEGKAANQGVIEQEEGDCGRACKKPQAGLSDMPATLQTMKLVMPRSFDREKREYERGILHVVETGDGFLINSSELKFQAGCPAGDARAKRSFLYKTFEFACGCLNARQNGTIYFGVAEETSRHGGGKPYKYGEIIGVEIDLKLQAQYYDEFRKFLCSCFDSEYSEVLKLCISRPHFILVSGSSPERYVIEVDVQPKAEWCQQNCFRFNPVTIFQEYGIPGKDTDFETKGGDEKKRRKKHIYIQNEKDWSGVFRRDGSSTKYISTKDLPVFLTDTLPKLQKEREVKEKQSEEQPSNQEAEKLKGFVGKFGPSMFPILVLPKLSDRDKQCGLTYFTYIEHIRWSAVFDFDDSSEVNGIYQEMLTSTVKKFEAVTAIATDFEDPSISELKTKLSFPTKTAWIFCNGISLGPKKDSFPRHDFTSWKDQYWSYLQTAIHAFYKSKSVIPPFRRYALFLISDENVDEIFELAREIMYAFGWDRVFFIFSSEKMKEKFAEELGPRLSERSVVMPWAHVHHVVCECLNVKGQNREKSVCLSNGTCMPIPASIWQSWTDLEIVGQNECKEEWEGLSREQKEQRSQDEEERFYKGSKATWMNFFCSDKSYNHVIGRSVTPNILKKVKEKAAGKEIEVDDDVPVVPLQHMPGAGGTTLGKHLLWTLKQEFKCAEITGIGEATESQIHAFWEFQEEDLVKSKRKPVILLLDNVSEGLSDTTEYTLRKNLHRKQIALKLSKPLAIMISCQREPNPSAEFHLSQKLFPDERDGFDKKYWELEGKYKKCKGEDFHDQKLETLIAFLAMRNGFEETFLKDKVVQFLNDKSLLAHERKLIGYMSLITSYFPASHGNPGLPVTSCDGLMDSPREMSITLPWECLLGEVAMILLVVEYRYENTGGRYYVRIGNQPYAKVILRVILEQNKQSLSKFAIQCLESELVSYRSLSTSTVHQILCDLLMKREIEEETGERSDLSPLIEEIKSKNVDEAAQVFLEGYKTLQNEAFYQHLARLYMTPSVSDLEKAKKYAHMAVDLADKVHFRHTLGVVYKKLFIKLKKSVRYNEEKILENLEHLSVAFEALSNFAEAQREVHDSQDSSNQDSQGSYGEYDTEVQKCFSFCERVEVINDVLDFFTRIFPLDLMHKVRRYLMEDYFELDMFDQKEGFRQTLKSLVPNGISAFRFLYYVGHSYSLRPSKHWGSGVTFHETVRVRNAVLHVRKKCVKTFKFFLQVLTGSRTLVLTKVSEHEDRNDNAYRLDILKHEGYFFESIFLQFQFLSNHSKARAQKVKTELKAMKQCLEEIRQPNYTDLDNLISVYLALELAEKDRTFSGQYSKVYAMCNDVIRKKRDVDNYCYMRAHMYRVLVSWPHMNSEAFNSAEFVASFQFRSQSLPLKPKVHFFLTNEDEQVYLCHWTAIFRDENDHDDFILTKTHRAEVLRSFSGRMVVGGKNFSRFIEFPLKCGAAGESLKIFKFRGQTENIIENACLEFYLGFSLHGPVAYIHKVYPPEDEALVP